MKETYNADFFIKFFEAIPDEKWCTHTIDDGQGRSCAWGHIIKVFGRSLKTSDAFENLLIDGGLHKYGDPSDINNGDHPKYQQPTPKARIISALNDIKS